MLSEKDYQDRLDRVQALREQVAQRLSGSLVSNPALAEELNRQIDALVDAAAAADSAAAWPAGRRAGRAGRSWPGCVTGFRHGQGAARSLPV